MAFFTLGKKALYKLSEVCFFKKLVAALSLPFKMANPSCILMFFMAFTNIGAAVLHASSAASFRVASNFSNLFSNPHFSAFSLTLMASGGNGNLIMSFFKNPPTFEACSAPFVAPIVSASFKPFMTSSLEIDGAVFMELFTFIPELSATCCRVSQLNILNTNKNEIISFINLIFN